jgi:lysophospholipase L1-like esterase
MDIFIGDSVTDCDREVHPPYGHGWVNEIVKTGRLTDGVLNVGTSGHRLVDLAARWQRDVLDHAPKRLTINIGINDTWRRYDDNDPTSVESFHQLYDSLLSQTQAAHNPHFVLCEPFLLHVQPEMKTWREDLDPKIAVVHELAKKYSATLVTFDAMFTELAETHGIEALAEDGIHPTQFGHESMASMWLKTVLGA